MPSEVMHRKVGQHRQRFAVRSLYAQKTQPRIGWTGRTNGIFIAVPRMHVGADGFFPERVEQFCSFQKRPPATSGKLARIHPAPRRNSWLQLAVCGDNRLDDFARQESSVARISPATEAVVHRTGGAVAVRRRNQNTVERDASFGGSRALGLVTQFSR